MTCNVVMDAIWVEVDAKFALPPLISGKVDEPVTIRFASVPVPLTCSVVTEAI